MNIVIFGVSLLAVDSGMGVLLEGELDGLLHLLPCKTFRVFNFHFHFNIIILGG